MDDIVYGLALGEPRVSPPRDAGSCLAPRMPQACACRIFALENPVGSDQTYPSQDQAVGSGAGAWTLEASGTPICQALHESPR